MQSRRRDPPPGFFRVGRDAIMSMYDRADIYDLRWNPKNWDSVRKHYENLLAGTDIHSVLDCSIGSGNLTLELAEMGYQVTGSDLSEAMLTRCREKALEKGLEVELFRSDFREISRTAPGTYDCVMSTGNSLPYVPNEDVVRTLEGMDRLVKPGGYLYVDIRNWDKVVEEKRQYYFYRPVFHDGLRVDTIQFWEHHGDGTITFHIVFTLERGKDIQREVFQELYHPIRRGLVESTLRRLGYRIERLETYPIQDTRPVDQSDWYCILARKA